MKTSSKYLRVAALFILIIQTTSFASVRTPRLEPHLIEVIIFSQEHTLNDEQETWDIDVKLSYDCNYMLLDRSSDKSSLKTNEPSEKNREMLFNTTDQTYQRQYAAEKEASTSEDNNFELEVNTSNRPKQKNLLFLSEEFHDLTRIKERLRLSKHYEVLFHESWNQVLTREKIATAIVIDSSKSSLLWPRIQGTISVFLNNFIHFKSDIWINVVKKGYTNPARLQPPPILTTKTRLDYQRTKCLNAGAIIEPSIGNYFISDKSEANTDASNSLRNYDWSYAIPMQDTQKIKTNQIHYLDHPFIGIILKITEGT